MSSRASLPLPPAARVPLLPLSPVAPSRFHPGASHSHPDSFPTTNCHPSRSYSEFGLSVSPSDSRATRRYFSLPLHRDFSVSTLPFLALKRCIAISLLSMASTHPYFSHLSFLKQPCQQLSFFLFRVPLSLILDTTSPVFLPDSPLSVPQYRLASFLTFAIPFFQHGLPISFHVSRFPSLLRCPSGCSTLFSDSHHLFLDAALPTEVRGALFPTPAGYNQRYLRAQHVHRSILAHLRSCQAGYIPAAASTPYPARVRVRSHYTLPRG